MTEKDFLERIIIAYKAYPYPEGSIEQFIKWMYKQYGMVEPKGLNYERSGTNPGTEVR